MFGLVEMPSFVTSTLAFLLSVGVLIMAHEWGHYIMAKRGGVPVEEFSIGFGPVARRLGQRGETTFNLRWLPVGGYVRMAGMEPGDDEDGGYNTKPMWTRAKIISAGVVVNLLLGFLLFVGLGISVGLPKDDQGKVSVGDVSANSAAQHAGLQKGDRILASDGAAVKDPQALTSQIQAHVGRPVTLTVQRGAQTVVIKAVPNAVQEGGKTIGRLGFVVVTEPVWERQSLTSSMRIGASRTWMMASGIVRMVFSRAMFQRGQVGGPIAIAQQAGGSAEMGGRYFLLFVAMLSINLGVLNLLPIPALDGGHILLLIVEAIRGRKLQAKTALVVQGLGFALLLMFICYATVSDVLRSFHLG